MGLIPSLLPSVWADSISREAHFHPIYFRNYTQVSVSYWAWVNTLPDLPPQAPVRIRCTGFPSPVLLLRCSVTQKSLLRPGSGPLPPSLVRRYPIKFRLITLTIYMTYFISEEIKKLLLIITAQSAPKRHVHTITPSFHRETEAKCFIAGPQTKSLPHRSDECDAVWFPTWGKIYSWL